MITGPSRHCLSILGSCLPNNLVNRIDARALNAAARRISDLPLTVRAGSLFFLSGANSYRNLYVRQCAQYVHASLISYGILTQGRLRREICAIYRARTTDLVTGTLDFDHIDASWEGHGGLPAQVVDCVRWLANPLDMTDVHTSGGMYYFHVPELRRIPARKRTTSLLDGALS